MRMLFIKTNDAERPLTALTGALVFVEVCPYAVWKRLLRTSIAFLALRCLGCVWFSPTNPGQYFTRAAAATGGELPWSVPARGRLYRNSCQINSWYIKWRYFSDK